MKDLRNLLNKRKIYVKDLLYQKSKKKFIDLFSGCFSYENEES